MLGAVGLLRVSKSRHDMIVLPTTGLIGLVLYWLIPAILSVRYRRYIRSVASKPRLAA